MADPYIERITSFLTSHGLAGFRFEHLAKHRVVVIPYQGRLNRVIFPSSGSDWRGPANTVSNIRHVLGLFEAKTSTERRVRKHKAKTACGHDRQVSSRSFVEPTSPAPDKFFGPLMALKARLEASTNPTAEETAVVQIVVAPSKPTRVALKTPWLGRHIRYATI
jgi:hypothetical protein